MQVQINIPAGILLHSGELIFREKKTAGQKTEGAVWRHLWAPGGFKIRKTIVVDVKFDVKNILQCTLQLHEHVYLPVNIQRRASSAEVICM